MFDVKPDPQRPFSVQAGALNATALGTTYAVRREGEQADVTVRRGRVAVAEGTGKVTLGAGERVAGRADGLGAKQAVDVDTLLAWEQGRLVFELTPLAQVLEQVERYRPGILMVSDTKLAALKVSGTFELDHLDEGLATLEKVFPLTHLRRHGCHGMEKPAGLVHGGGSGGRLQSHRTTGFAA